MLENVSNYYDIIAELTGPFLYQKLFRKTVQNIPGCFDVKFRTKPSLVEADQESKAESRRTDNEFNCFYKTR